jgi:hypothetical protein
VRLHLHGVVRADHPFPQGGALRPIGLGDLAVAVSETPDGAAFTGEQAAAHVTWLSALVVNGPVLPLRLGTTVPDENAARTAVAALGPPALRGHLDRLEGLAEVHVHVAFDEESALRAVFDEADDQQALLRGGTDLASNIRHGELIAHRLVAWRRRQADELLAPIAVLAQRTAPVADFVDTEERRAYLVPLDRVETARALVTGLGTVRAVFTGPLPAYSFLDATPVAEPDPFEARPTSRWGW